MKGILRQHRIRLALGIPLMILAAYSINKALELASVYGTCGEMNKWTAIGSIAAGFAIEAIYTILRDWYDNCH